MAAGTWSVWPRAKHHLGLGNIDLSGGTFKAVLFQTGASANLAGDVSTLASIGSFTCTAGNGDEVATLAGLIWTGSVSASSATRKWDCTNIVFTASTQAISSVRYCVLYLSNGASAGTGIPVCYAALSTTAFAVGSGNTLTVQPATGGIFSLA